MQTFRSRRAPTEVKALAAHVDQMGASLEKAARASSKFMQLEVLYAEPTQRSAGMLVYADGSTWNPGSGEGVYRRTVAGSWTFIG